MIGKIHYSKRNHVHVVAENNRVYYTKYVVDDCAFANGQQIYFEVIDEANSIADNLCKLR